MRQRGWVDDPEAVKIRFFVGRGTEISADNEALLQRAEREGLWLFAPYYELWLSPEEFRVAREKGYYSWNSDAWQGRHPSEWISSHETDVRSSKIALARATARLQRARDRVEEKTFKYFFVNEHGGLKSAVRDARSATPPAPDPSEKP